MTRHITLSGLTNGACRCANKRYEGTISAKFYVFSASAKSLIDLKFENKQIFSFHDCGEEVHAELYFMLHAWGMKLQKKQNQPTGDSEQSPERNTCSGEAHERATSLHHTL